MTIAGLTPDAGRRRGWWAILLAVLAVGALMLLRPLHAPPLYDGLGFPDEPYRWVQPPAGAPKTPAVTPATAEGRIGVDGVVPTLKGLSAEQGSQIAFQIDSGNLVVPKGAKNVTAKAVAGPNPSVVPPQGVLVSNVYTLTVGTDAATGEPTMAPGKKIIVNMRADKATNDIVVMEAFEEGVWTQIATARVGTEIYASELPGPGQFALVKLPVGASPSVSAASNNGFNTPTTTSPQGTTTSTNGSVLYIAAGGMVLLLLLGLFIARKRMGSG